MIRHITWSKILSRDWVVALFLLVIFLLTNGYTLGWDDQHLEIPLLKSLIDPSLYAGDYYVESLKQNFPSLLYPILGRVISVAQIPVAYFILYLLSRYFLFFWMYKLWRFLAHNRLAGFLCVLMVIVLGRVDEFLYRTFSHQEFALAIIFAGIYFFYKERFVLASALLGAAANIHALYSLFPQIYLLVYLLRYVRRYRWPTFMKSGVAFLVSALPLVILTVRKHLGPLAVTGNGLDTGWIDLYLVACPQNFLFNDVVLKDLLSHSKIFWAATKEYWLLLALFFLNIFHQPRFRQDKKGLVLIATGAGLLILSFVCSYIFPIRFILDLNLDRNTQFVLFLLIGYTVLLLLDRAQEEPWWVVVLMAAAFPLIRFRDYTSVFAIGLLFFLLTLAARRQDPNRVRRIGFSLLLLAGMGLCLWGIARQFILQPYSLTAKRYLIIGLALTAANALALGLIRNPRGKILLRRLFVVIPLILYSINFVFYHHRHLRVERQGRGFWQLQRGWIDMQRYVRDHTPRDALLLVPYDMEMGGFRIFSEREIICSYRDCGIIGFDYGAAVEWQRRIKDIEPFKVIIDAPISSAVMNAVLKYKVNYIVFMGYLDPGRNPVLEPVYRNGVFVLYKVLPNPI